MTLTHSCYETLLDLILRAELLPGDKLKVLPLSKRLNTGPTPVREALSRLTETGLVEATNNKGFRVATITEEEVTDLYETYIDIETLALHKAIDNGDKDWESNIVAALYRLKQLEEVNWIIEENYKEWTQLNQSFHRTLAEGCGSKTLMEIRSLIYKKFERIWNFAFGGKVKKFKVNHQDHVSLAEACLKRDKAKLSLLIKEHTQSGLERIKEELKK